MPKVWDWFLLVVETVERFPPDGLASHALVRRKPDHGRARRPLPRLGSMKNGWVGGSECRNSSTLRFDTCKSKWRARSVRNGLGNVVVAEIGAMPSTSV